MANQDGDGGQVGWADVEAELREETAPRREAAPRAGGSVALLDELELPLEVRLGREVWPLERVLSLRVGEAVPVGPEGDDAVTLYIQERPYAAGDLVVVDGRFAFRVRELLGDAQRGDS
ncbi:MAG: FliM/FliN family flagellar motor switch protein [Acidobacteria bacterium]|nr:FliM/FliN family flagellar motor switch protein [Acidobacteriota bacterium]